ncbi:hypothetical protein [Polyangium aurulentum]|uniref:hypothetical protein n=1 Tax=Polyangium aurulentum TaxID=2567896 RepID=UPI0010AE2B13|nr:hypothetical protein [Polyangium aurulentum]UQA57056.1 hypothetical protein E8A73_038065 [Polyangium aurulentum]
MAMLEQRMAALEQLEPRMAALEQLEPRVVRVEKHLEEMAKLLKTREQLIQGWGAIAKEIGCSESHARRLAGPNQSDPLPYHRRRGVVIAIASELKAWQVRQTAPGRRHSAKGAGSRDRHRSSSADDRKPR